MQNLLFISIFILFQSLFAKNASNISEPNPPIQPPKQPEVNTNGYSSPPKGGVKNATASGRYYGGNSHEYDPEYYQTPRSIRNYEIPLIDEYVCDLDTPILIVTNSDPSHASDDSASSYAYGRSKRHSDYYKPRRNYYGRDYPQRNYYNNYEGYGRDRFENPSRDPRYGYDAGAVASADRLKCSVIASVSYESCTVCCKLAGRQSPSISKDKIEGLLVDNNQLIYDTQTQSYVYNNRKKRSNHATPLPVNPDERCMCCSPKRYRFYAQDRYPRRNSRYQTRGPY